MFDFDFGKLLLLAVIALIVLGPEKLPKAARMAGAMLRRVRIGWDSVRAEVERELELEEMRQAARQARESAESVRKTANEKIGSARASVDDAVTDVGEAVGTTDDARAREGPNGDL